MYIYFQHFSDGLARTMMIIEYEFFIHRREEQREDEEEIRA
jgi:hypothetical protein